MPDDDDVFQITQEITRKVHQLLEDGDTQTSQARDAIEAITTQVIMEMAAALDDYVRRLDSIERSFQPAGMKDAARMNALAAFKASLGIQRDRLARFDFTPPPTLH